MSLLSLPDPAASASTASFAAGSRRLAPARRPLDRRTLSHHVAVLPMPARALALVTGHVSGDSGAEGLLVRWAATRLRALCARLLAGEVSGAAYRQDASGIAGLGPDPAPAGEAMLVGLAAAARRLAASRTLSEAAVVAFLPTIATVGGSGVSAEVRRALEDAARGGFPEPVAAFVELLGDSEAEDGALRDAVARLAPAGARPGADALAGIVALARDVAIGSL